MDEIMVSIICTTYNHEKYIKDAIDSFIRQKTNFKYEILVNDDASTDNTPNILHEYEKEYPEIIKVIYQKENQYSKGVNITNSILIPIAKGKYVAICEGDDYWIDDSKLQKQYDLMENHPEINICSHSSLMVNSETKKTIKKCSPSQKNCIIPVQKVILGGGGFVMTNSLFVRRELFFNPLLFHKLYSMDYSLQIYGSINQGMLYISDFMSSYRIMSDHSWVRKMSKDIQARKKSNRIIEQMLIQLNKDTGNKYIALIYFVIIKNRIINFVRDIKHYFKEQIVKNVKR